MSIKFEGHEIVEIVKDIPAHGVMSGDTGTIVGTYESGGIEVEFMNGVGNTKGVLTLN